MASTLHYRFLGYDEGKQQLSLNDTDHPDAGWCLDLAELPLARALQRIGPDRALVGFDRGFFELKISTGKVLLVREGWKTVTSVRRLPDGNTLVTGVNLEGQTGVCVLTLDADHQVKKVARRDGDYVRMLSLTDKGTYLLCTNDHILETTPDLEAVGELRTEGFLHAWQAHRYPDGSTLVAGGYGAFMARFDARGQLIQKFGGKDQMPAEVAPNFYASMCILDNGHILAANWQGHGPDNGHKGRQLVEFSAAGDYLASWSNQERISSLQGLLVL